MTDIPAGWLTVPGVVITLVAMIAGQMGWAFYLALPLCLGGICLGIWRAIDAD